MIDYKEQQKDQRWAARSREIMERDNFTCQLCGKKNLKLNVHHIKYNKNLNYWEYPDELLLTVCEVCHAKIHGKYTKRNVKPTNKLVIYLDILRLKDLTPNCKIILSDLISKKDIIKDVSQRKHSKELNISLKSYSLCINTLRSKGCIDKDNSVLIDLSSIKYFPLLIDSGLKSELLIFYSYLKNKCEYFGGSIDTFKYKIAKDFCTTKIAVTNMLNRLYRKGLAERLPNGRLKIN